MERVRGEREANVNYRHVMLPGASLRYPGAMHDWSLTSLQTRMIKTGGRLVRHARRLVFQLAG